MENLNLKEMKHNTIDNCGNFSVSENRKNVRSNEKCNCGLSYKEYWTRIFNRCEKCLRSEQLEKENKELKEQVELAEINLEEFIDKSEDWNQQQLVQKDEKFEEFPNRVLKKAIN